MRQASIRRARAARRLRASFPRRATRCSASARRARTRERAAASCRSRRPRCCSRRSVRPRWRRQRLRRSALLGSRRARPRTLSLLSALSALLLETTGPNPSTMHCVAWRDFRLLPANPRRRRSPDTGLASPNFSRRCGTRAAVLRRLSTATRRSSTHRSRASRSRCTRSTFAATVG